MQKKNKKKKRDNKGVVFFSLHLKTSTQFTILNYVSLIIFLEGKYYMYLEIMKMLDIKIKDIIFRITDIIQELHF